GPLGAIRGPSSVLADQGKEAATVRNVGIKWTGKEWSGTLPPAPPAAAGRGGAAGGRGGAPGGAPAGAGAGPAQGFTTQDGFRSTRVAIMIAYDRSEEHTSELQS